MELENNSKYPIGDKTLAEYIIRESLNRLKDAEVFGSGWPTLKKSNPQFIVEKDYVLVFGSVEPI